MVIVTLHVLIMKMLPLLLLLQVSDFGLSRLLTSEAPVIETRTYGTVTHM